jgi:hypothetical protein
MDGYAFLTRKTFCSSYLAPLILSNRLRTTSATEGASGSNTKSVCNNSSNFLKVSDEEEKENDSTTEASMIFDKEYPGTAVVRLNNVRARVATLSMEDLSGDWADVRRKILWAGGLKDLPNAVPGQGYTGHSFNDYNHVDLTTMNAEVSSNENDGAVSHEVAYYFFSRRSY